MSRPTRRRHLFLSSGLALWLALALALATAAAAQGPVVAPTAAATPAPTPAFPTLPDGNLQFGWELVQRYGWAMALVALVILFVGLALWKGLGDRLATWFGEQGAKLAGWVQARLKPPPPLSQAERDYLEKSVNRKYSAVELRALDERESRTEVRLREVYIPLRGRGGRAEPRDDTPGKGARSEGFITDRQAGEPPLLTTILARNPRLVVRGRAGSGKTTFLKFVATGLADALLHGNRALLPEGLDCDPIPFPIYFPLVDFNAFLKEHKKTSDLTAHKEDEALLDFLVDQFGTSGLNADFFARRLEAGRCIIFLDGLDEVAAGRRQTILELVGAFIRRYDPDKSQRENRFVIASRPEATLDVVALSGFEDAEVLPLTIEMVEDFVPRWYRELMRDQPDTSPSADDYSRGLLAAIHNKPQVRELTESPLLLTLVALMHYRQQLPDNRKDLYERCTRLLLEDWEKSRPGETGRQIYREHAPPGIPEDWRSRASYLEPVAYWMLDSSQTEAHADQWLNQIIDRLHLSQAQEQRDTLKAFLEWAVRRGALLEKRSPDEDVYGFAYHKTFREYLAARYLSDPSHFATTVKLAGSRDWTETLRLLASELKPPRQREFLEAALEQHPDVGALLVGEALVEIKDDSLRTQLGPGAHARLKALMVDLAVPAVDRAQAGRLVCQLGDDRPGVGVIDGVPDIDWVTIPAGEFIMGSDKAGPHSDPDAYDDEEPRHGVTLPAFRISRYPITVAQFRPFVGGDGYTNPGYWTADGRKWKADRRAPAVWNDPQWNLDNHPVIGVSWYEAHAYCQWLTAQGRAGLWQPPTDAPKEYVVRLPTEAEWEKAARGKKGRRYPWGATFDSNRCNAAPSEINRTSAAGIFPLPDGPWPDNPLDMSGNVWEWTLSLWGSDYKAADFLYPYVAGDGREDETAGPDVLRVVRGGSWYYNQRDARCASRLRYHPDLRDDDLGFRVVLAPPTSGQLNF